jgi:molybdopterin/thiamine biosynthesis adenylyltransferase
MDTILESLRNLSFLLFDSLSPAELTRYDKQLHLKDWGLAAQKKLKTSSVFVAGTGGLVTAAAFNLVASGVGHLKMVDAERVSLKDLDDQIIYRKSDLNKPKVSVVRQQLQEANPFSRIEGLERKISDQDAVNLTHGADLLLADLNEVQNASVLNWAAIKCQIPLLLSWTKGMRGYIITLKPGQGLCLDCTSMTEWANTSDTALLAPMSTIMGGLMALEALRILGGPGPVLLERLFVYDGDLGQSIEKPIRRKKKCVVCSKPG